jgi:hypothetical protein
MTDQEHYKKLKKDLLGKLIRCTNRSLSFGDSVGLVTKVEWVEADIGNGIRIWSSWPGGWIDAGFGKGVVYHDWFRFSGSFEVIQ